MSLPKILTIKTDTGEELTLFQALNSFWCCPACGSAELTQQPYNEKGSATFEICDCMFQIGYDDNPLANEEAIEGIQNNWHRWRRQLLKTYNGQVDKLSKLKAQLSQIGIKDLPFENEAPEQTLTQNSEPLCSSHNHYHDPLLTRLYDLQNPWGPDCDFYLSLAKDHSPPLKVLDLGCGTGLLTTAFAKAGHEVTGIDPALEMLNIAIRKPFGEKVMWVKATAQTFASENHFDLIVLSGHAFQVFLTDEDIQAALKSMRMHLAPNGRIAFEIRNPEGKTWQNWTPKNTLKSFTLPPSNAFSAPEDIEVWHDIDDVENCGIGKLVRYNTLYRKISATQNNAVKTTDTIRFLSKEELLSHLDQAGLTPNKIYGDWDYSPFKPDSKEIIVIAGLKADT
ncbi:MAG: methyltransferase domain-containing protein [Halopseudomonas aestusnigri]